MRLRVIAFCAVLSTTLACESDETAVDHAGLRTGSYRFSSSAIADGCDVGTLTTDYDGERVEILSVSATTVVFERNEGPVALSRTGNVIAGEQEPAGTFDYVNDFADYGLSQPYNCVEQDYLTMTLTITSETAMDYDEVLTYTATIGSASDCIAANASAYSQVLTSFPCETAVDSALTRD